MRDSNTLVNLSGKTITVIISGSHTLRQAALRQGLLLKAGKYTVSVIRRSNRNVNLYQVQAGEFTFMAVLKADDHSDDIRLVTFYYGQSEADVLEHRNNSYAYGLDTRAKNNDALTMVQLVEIYKEIKEDISCQYS